jgi:hypothetical protein
MRPIRTVRAARTAQHHVKIRVSRVALVAPVALQPTSLSESLHAHGRPRRCSDRRTGAAMRTHARDAFNQCSMHEQDTVRGYVAVHSPTQGGSTQHNARSVVRAADSDPRS